MAKRFLSKDNEETHRGMPVSSNVGKASIGFPFLVFFTCAVELDPVVVVARLEVLGVTSTGY